MGKKRKNLLKNDPITPANLSYEERVKRTTSVAKKEKKEVKEEVKEEVKSVKEKPLTPTSHIQFITARPKTNINARER
tara:strand:- start:4121 stop:4354 length:234 start_codon:yes stop_codon:yes gene_type:complete